MRLNYVLKYAFTGLLLSAPLCAFADNVSIHNVKKPTNHANISGKGVDGDVGVYITVTAADNGKIYYNNDTTGVTFDDPSNSITIGGVNITGSDFPSSPAALGVIGVGINNENSYSLENTTPIKISDITLNGSSTNAVGFINLSNVTSKFGELKIGNISIKNTLNGGDARSLGVGFLNHDELFANSTVGEAIEGNIFVGDIDVAGQAAIGFWSGNLENANVILQNVTANNNSANYKQGAIGIRIATIEDNASLQVQDITVNNNGNAAGGTTNVMGIQTSHVKGDLEIGNIKVDSSSTDATGMFIRSVANGSAFNVGKIEVTSANNATGINIYDVPNVGSNTLTLTNDVIAKATNAGAATGIRIERADLTIDTVESDVEISGVSQKGIGTSIAMVNTGNSLTITGDNTHENKGKKFIVSGADNVTWETNANYIDGSSFTTTTNATTSHKAVNDVNVIVRGNITTGGNYKVGDASSKDFHGTIVAQKLVAGGNTEIQSGTLLLDATAGSTVNGNLVVGGGAEKAAIGFYGNVKAGQVALDATGTVTFNPNGTLLNLGSITQFTLKGNDIVSSNRKSALMSDGFLLAGVIHSRMVAWEATRDHFISGGMQRARYGRGFLGQAPCDPCEPVSDCDPCEPVCDDDSCGEYCGHNHHFFDGGLLLGSNVGRSAWVNYVGRSGEYRSSYTNNGDWDIGSDGVQVGLDLYKTHRSQFGLLFGYEGTKATLRADRLEADDVYFGVYAARVFHNGADFRAIYNYGTQDYKMRRFDPGQALNINLHNTEFDGKTHEVNLELGKRFFAHRGWSYRPVIGFDLLINEWDGATEDGALATAIIYNDSDYMQAFLRLGTDVKYTHGRFEYNSGLYYSYDLKGDSLRTRVTAKGSPTSTTMLYGSDLGRSVLTFNVGGSYALSECASVFGGYTGDARLDCDGDGFQSIGYVGLQWKW